MAIKVGINGFGRIGRLVFRAGLDNPNIEFVGINDPFMTPDYCAYMLKYDTVHGRYTGDVKFTEDSIIVEGKEVKFYAEKDPANIPWAACGAEYVVDSPLQKLARRTSKAVRKRLLSPLRPRTKRLLPLLWV